MPVLQPLCLSPDSSLERAPACAQTQAVQQLAVFQQALQEIDEDEEAALERQLASLLSTQASGDHMEDKQNMRLEP